MTDLQRGHGHVGQQVAEVGLLVADGLEAAVQVRAELGQHLGPGLRLHICNQCDGRYCRWI